MEGWWGVAGWLRRSKSTYSKVLVPLMTVCYRQLGVGGKTFLGRLTLSEGAGLAQSNPRRGEDGANMQQRVHAGPGKILKLPAAHPKHAISGNAGNAGP